MSVFQAAMPTGSYPSLMAGGVVAGKMTPTTDINDFYGADWKHSRQGGRECHYIVSK